MSKRILIIDGHPDSHADRYIHALSKSYFDGAQLGGHEVRSIIVSEIEFPLLRTSADFQGGQPPESIRRCQELLQWAEHVVILFPLWLGSMPALLKAFLEQALRPGFAFAEATGHGLPRKLLGGRSVRIIVTMGMPAFFYRWYFRAHSLKSLQRNILRFCGFRPVNACVVGMVDGMSQAQRGDWLARVQKLGVRGKWGARCDEANPTCSNRSLRSSAGAGIRICNRQTGARAGAAQQAQSRSRRSIIPELRGVPWS